ncbi:PDR/VanB family oxidoreductase [Streptomyces sp. NPDC091215]|uniref:PDR/VanB family oxidoreductase n=1 Tax=Streptomyces sp. NPDC091215 TaxID=3155192 RepID=UPI003428D76F
MILDLRDPAGADLPAWSPGAHIDLQLPIGVTRQYSLCGDPADRSVWRIGVLLEPGGRGGSAHVHQALHPDMTIDVVGPRNHFELLPSRRCLFIAGGIGITPILPMLTAADRTGTDWELHYGGRSRRSMAFLEPLAAATGDRVTLYPQVEVGLPDLDRILATPRADTLVYCCGPEPLLKAVEERCRSWPAGSLHVERFAPKDLGTPVLAGSFEVELATRGLTLTVPPDRSILDVVEEAGVSMLTSCREGTCGSCETGVLAGAVDHRDSLLSPEEQAANDVIFICVSRAAGARLVLDL